MSEESEASLSSTATRRARSSAFSTCSRWSCERRPSFSSSRSAIRPEDEADPVEETTLVSRVEREWRPDEEEDADEEAVLPPTDDVGSGATACARS